MIIGTPIDLSRVVKIEKPHTRVTYELEDFGDLRLKDLVQEAVR